MDLHERLRKAREHANIASVKDAAESLGVKYSTYAGHENGTSGFRSDKGELYARRFKVRFEWLMRGKGPMLPDGEVEPAGSSEREIRAMLKGIEGLKEADIEVALAVISNALRVNAGERELAQSRDQSEPASPRRG